MFGMVNRIGFIYEYEENERLVFLRLLSSFAESGVFKASKSFMIKDKTKGLAESQSAKLKDLLMEEYKHTEYEIMPFRLFSGSYPFWQYKEFYADALERYVFTLTETEEAYAYITKNSKKIEYLHKKLDQLCPNFRASLYPEKSKI